MIRLFTIRALIAGLKRAISLSEKLSPATWQFIATFNIVLFLCLLIYPVPVTQDYKVAHIQIDNSNSVSRLDDDMLIYSTYLSGDMLLPTNYVRTYSATPIISLMEWKTYDLTWSASYWGVFHTRCDTVIVGSETLLRGDPFNPIPFFREPPTVFGWEAPKREDWQQTILFWANLFSLVASPIISAAAMIFAWISLHRRRAEALLMRLELEKRRLEIEQLRLELERARREYEEHKPAIVVVSS